MLKRTICRLLDVTHFLDVIIGGHAFDLFIEAIWKSTGNLENTWLFSGKPILQESKLKLTLLNDGLILTIYRHTQIMDYVSINISSRLLWPSFDFRVWPSLTYHTTARICTCNIRWIYRSFNYENVGTS